MAFQFKFLKFWNVSVRVLAYVIPVLIIIGCFSIYFGKNWVSFVYSILFPTLVVLNLVLLVLLISKKNKLFLLPVLGFLVFFLCLNSFIQLNTSANDKNSESLSLLTFNTQGFFSKDLEKKILTFIEEKNPDIIVFQEFSAIKYHLFKKEYPYWLKTNIMAPNKSVLAIFSKYPIKDNGVLDFSESNNNAVYADILYNNELIRLYNLHLESFGLRLNSSLYSEKGISAFLSRISISQKKRREQVEIVLSHSKTFKGKSIICGDFNSTQYSSTYVKLKEGKKDSFIEKGNGLGITYSFRGYPLRLDYFLVDEKINVLSHKNFNLKYSDHEPVFVELGLD